MNQFQIAERDKIKCDLCGGDTIALYGGGWDNDRVLCVDRDCYAEIVYPTTTCVDDAEVE